MNGLIGCEGELSAIVIRKDGRREYLGTLRPPTGLLAFWYWLKGLCHRPVQAIRTALMLCVFLIALGIPPLAIVAGGLMVGLVTTAGVNYMASDFASGGATPTISGMKYHACGTGTTAAAIGDTALQTDSGVARVIGTPTNPSANVYKSVATMAFVSTLAITEWGLFSALTSGTLWDHRVFSAINVVSGDSIQFSYSLTIAAGGS